MDKAKDGGPAFARAGFDARHPCDSLPERGMSLRDYFAAKIAAGDAAASEWVDVGEQQIQRRVRLYYKIADAMLKEREK